MAQVWIVPLAQESSVRWRHRMPSKDLCADSPVARADRPVWLPRFVLVRHVARTGCAIAVVGLTLTGACCPKNLARETRPGEKAPDTKSECPEPELPEATIRTIGYVAVREKDPELPPTPLENILITRYECNYLYTEVFAPDTIGGDVTVVISPDGRVLDVLPSM